MLGFRAAHLAPGAAAAGLHQREPAARGARSDHPGLGDRRGDRDRRALTSRPKRPAPAASRRSSPGGSSTLIPDGASIQTGIGGAPGRGADGPHRPPRPGHPIRAWSRRPTRPWPTPGRWRPNGHITGLALGPDTFVRWATRSDHLRRRHDHPRRRVSAGGAASACDQFGAGGRPVRPGQCGVARRAAVERSWRRARLRQSRAALARRTSDPGPARQRRGRNGLAHRRQARGSDRLHRARRHRSGGHRTRRRRPARRHARWARRSPDRHRGAGPSPRDFRRNGRPCGAASRPRPGRPFR